MAHSPRLITRQAPADVQQKLYRAGFSPLIARVLAGRGITQAHQATMRLENMLTPHSMKGMDDAVALCIQAITKNWRVLVAGDYDCDGATATTLMVSALRRWGVNTHYVVPNRETMGYGLSPALAALILQQPPDLVITVDNGIASHEGVQTLMQAGVKVLITDHHLPAATLPAASAIINPNQPGCAFPSKALAGVGVAFYLLVAIRAALRELARAGQSSLPDMPLGEYLDLVALGTVADLVPLDENNRILVHFGLKRIREGKARAGINALLREAGRRVSSASTSDLGFYVGPRINAAGRMADMTLGIECLLAADHAAHAEMLATQLAQMNLARRAAEQQMKAEALTLLEGLALPNDARTITLQQADWHLGVIGIVASRVKEQSGKPTFIFTQDGEGRWRGSGRSVVGLHLRDCLDWMAKQEPNLFRTFGGHAMAAGATLNEAPHLRFAAAFTRAALALCPAMLDPVVASDGPLAAADLNVLNVQSLEGMVWGQSFPAPLFHDTFKVERWHNIKDRHWKLWVQNENIRGTALFFNVPETFNVNPQCQQARFSFGLMLNQYQGNTEVVLRIEHWLDAPT